jgi:hypothetical protein
MPDAQIQVLGHTTCSQPRGAKNLRDFCGMRGDWNKFCHHSNAFGLTNSYIEVTYLLSLFILVGSLSLLGVYIPHYTQPHCPAVLSVNFGTTSLRSRIRAHSSFFIILRIIMPFVAQMSLSSQFNLGVCYLYKIRFRFILFAGLQTVQDPKFPSFRTCNGCN